MNHEYDFLNELNNKQKSVCISEENFLLTACPGSGKTRTITYRLAYLSKKYKDSRLLNIAITYTNRAADEIENRLMDFEVDTSNIWTGTIHQFCSHFIIRPYAMYHSKLNKGYRIIDEYIKEKYIDEIAKRIGIKGCIRDFYKNPKIMSEYKKYIIIKREIDFENILEYSLELLKDNKFIADNISGLIRSIHVDEYQDTNELQYLILSEIVKTKPSINISFVGDVNQAIYSGLGGVAKNLSEIEKLFPVKFKNFCLDGCYRSTQRVVDYYINYEIESTGLFSTSKIRNEKGVIKHIYNVHKDDLAEKISFIIKGELRKGIPENEICVLAPQWGQIYHMSNKLREILPDCNFDSPNITPIKYDPLNVYFLIAKLLFTKKSEKSFLRRKMALKVIKIITEDYGIYVSDNIDKFDVLKAINSTNYMQGNGIKTLKNAISNVFNTLKIDIANALKTEYDDFFGKIDNRIKKYNLKHDCDLMEKNFQEKQGIVINTIHGVKGEEYTTVIAFDLLEGHLPNWEYIINSQKKLQRKNEANKLLYVLCSRAKENIYLFSEKGRITKKGKPYSPTTELKNIDFDYD
ncbi:ATP-dependent helicase [Campylobacter blaseri]|uniref:DNA 3'-5' helicase n=1 Tax=Campylobacter blaseri TaxID=2042961 RepID=A0A2P8QZ73_9BACT|nr:ATP-dependent helicase [Campylobacter blaseri]PSM51531.1 AAA family ATPase [Campylobacter blaseri]PSM53324.1 AAA family ATPase [Campylobacter blaseri]QKF86618.1 ATP-dependent helicase [Campylobacter blaseri]